LAMLIGLLTAFNPRLTEYGSAQRTDLKPDDIGRMSRLVSRAGLNS
jgi:hypothetical protein